MPGLTADTRNLMLQALRENVTHMSLHDDDPGATGANNEIDHTNYSRASMSVGSFNTPTAGEMYLSGPISFQGEADAPVTYIGLWDDSTFRGAKAITGDTQFNSEGDFVISDSTKFELDNATF